MESRRVRLLAALLVLALGVGQTPALAGPADVATSRRYIQANYALVQFAAARLHTARAALDRVLGKARSECPNAAAGSPQNPESTMVSYEIIGAMVLAAYHAGLPQIRAFVAVAARSRWSSRALTRTIHAYAGKLKTLSTLAAPNLCRDIRAWAANGYTKLPPTTVAFDRLFIPAWVALGELPGQLSASAPADQRGMLQRTRQLEDRLSNFESAAVETYGQIMDTLQVNQ